MASDEHFNQIFLIKDLRQPGKAKGCSTVKRITRTRSDSFLLVQPAFWWDLNLKFELQCVA